MKKIVSFFVLGVTLIATGCKDEQPIISLGPENTAGTYNRTVTTSDGIERDYIVYVPETAVGRQKVPVLLMIHGTNQSGRVHYDKNLWNPKADQEGFIVVYPTALVYCHFDNGVERTVTKWTAGDLGETDVARGALPLCPGETMADDMLFFDELIVRLQNDFAVDEKRIYATGFSNGAQMTARLAAQRSEVFAAVTVHAGNLSRFIPSTLSARPMSLMVSVGARDGLFLDAISQTGPIPVDTTLMDVPGVAEVIQPFLDISGLENQYSSSVAQYGGVDVAGFIFQTSNVGLDNRFRFVLIDKLAHSYTEVLIDPFWTFLEGQALP